MKPDELITYLKKLRRPNKFQLQLLDLHQKQDLSATEKKTYQALIKAEISSQRARKAKSQARHLVVDEQQKAATEERKARNHRLILQGTLIDLAGLQDRSRGEILGMLLMAELADEARWAAWKTEGDALLAAKGEEL
jgi:hypothetical protein